MGSHNKVRISYFKPKQRIKHMKLTDVVSETWRPGGACRRKQSFVFFLKSRVGKNCKEEKAVAQSMIWLIGALETETRRCHMAVIHDREL